VATAPDSDDLDFDYGLTAAAWIYPYTIGTDQNVIFKGTFSYALALDSSGVPVFAGSFTTPVYGPNILPTNAWTHLAATYDGSQINLYVNGVLAATQPENDPVADGVGELMIGGNATVSGKTFNGIIDEVLLFNRALTQSEIQSEMGLPPTPRVLLKIRKNPPPL
jgi:hypothetical protein